MQADDRQAFEELFRRHWWDLYQTAFRRMRDSSASEDIVQDVMADLWIRRQTAQITNLAAYLQSAVRFQVIKRVTRDKVRSSFTDLFDRVTGASFSPDNNLSDKELTALVQAWLASLPEKRRTIFLYHYRDQLSTREIADRLGVSQKTVQNQLGLAARELHRKLLPSLLQYLALVSS